MKTATLLYSTASGRGHFEKHLDYVKSRLEPQYELKAVLCRSLEEEIELACSCQDDALIVVGGDGTFQAICGALSERDRSPLIGYINGGTLGDVGRNFGVTKRLSQAVKIIEEGATTALDIGTLNDEHFVYMAAIGDFADIAYATPREKKKRLGKFAYYQKAVGEALHQKSIHVRIESDGNVYEGDTPFLLVMSGKRVGGFAVNKDGDYRDGKLELYVSPKGKFNGLLHYFFNKKKVLRLVGDAFQIEAPADEHWCLDGEKGPSGNASIGIKKRVLRVFCAKKYAEAEE